jgi:hypothetical protein
MLRYLWIGVIILGVLACQLSGATQVAPIVPSEVAVVPSQVDNAGAVETGVAAALTASAVAAPPTEPPPPTDTQVPEQPPTEIPASTATKTPRLTSTDKTAPWPINTATKVPTPTVGACFIVLDSWCLSHEGCATMTVLNKTTESAKLYFSRDSWSSSYTQAAGGMTPTRCTIMLQPGRYYYKFTYCGKTQDGYHALNDNWYIEFKCK